MHSVMEKLPKALSTYLNGLMKEEGFTTEDKKNRFVKNWLKKRALFDKIVEHNGFITVDKAGVDCKAGIVLITYSGSLLTISGEKQDKTRDVVYESIKLRQDKFPKTEENSITVDFPIVINQSVNLNGGKLVKTSPVFSLAVEEKQEGGSGDVLKRFAAVRGKITEALMQVNKMIFSKSEEGSLEDRQDLFMKWVVLTWFQIGGWKEEVFLIRAHLLWMELFDKVYNELTMNIKKRENQDTAFLEMSNQQFTEYCDVYKWLESEKKDFDIGLMRALEEIPGQPEYASFVEKGLKSLIEKYR
ncbi:MAG: hypothetical protein JXJ04_13475 [Spirochaetales bacterium]|nr:hypothetical protein [Spirochaetales bacterium]